MSYGRQPVLVTTNADGYFERAFSVEAVGNVVRVGYGLYLMVPVATVKEGAELADRLSHTSCSSEAKDNK